MTGGYMALQGSAGNAIRFCRDTFRRAPRAIILLLATAFVSACSSSSAATRPLGTASPAVEAGAVTLARVSTQAHTWELHLVAQDDRQGCTALTEDGRLLSSGCPILSHSLPLNFAINWSKDDRYQLVYGAVAETATRVQVEYSNHTKSELEPSSVLGTQVRYFLIATPMRVLNLVAFDAKNKQIASGRSKLASSQ